MGEKYLTTNFTIDNSINWAKYFTGGLVSDDYHYNYPIVEKIIYNLKNPNKPCTIVYWNDGTKTIVKCCEGEDFTKDGGLAQAYLKKILGSRGNIQRLIENADIQE